MSAEEYGKDGTGYRCERRGDTVCVDLVYPDQHGLVGVRVGLEDVRCVDDLLIRFDYDRNCWVISRQVHRDVGGAMEDVTGPVELLLVPAWTEERSEAT